MKQGRITVLTPAKLPVLVQPIKGLTIKAVLLPSLDTGATALETLYTIAVAITPRACTFALNTAAEAQ